MVITEGFCSSQQVVDQKVSSKYASHYEEFTELVTNI